MDLSCGGIPPEKQALETPGHYIPATPEKSATTKRTLISVFNGQGIPAFESLVDVPVALLSPLPGKSVSSTVNQIVTSPVASITPGNDKSVQHCNLKEAVPLAIEDLNNKRRLKEFHMLQTGATGKRIDLCADNGFSNPAAPLTPYKDKTAENCQPPETTELADMRLTVGNIQENCMNKKVPFLDANSSLGGLYPRYMENERDEDEETQGIDLNKTPRKKFVKRKRHRPKVIQEDKPIRSPKPITPKIDENKEELTPKRTYVRKKQRLISSSRCPSAAIEEKKEKPIPIKTYVRKRKTSSSSASGTNLCSTSPTEVRNVDPLSRDTTKSVRRSLNFSLEGDTRDDVNVSTENDVEFVALKTFNCSSIGCSREFTVELTQGLEVSLTESPVGIAFDLNRSLNQVLEEYIQLPEHPTLSAQSYRRETVKEHLKDFNSTKDVDSDMCMQSCQEKFDAGSHLDIILIDNDIDKIGTKRDYEHIDVSKDCSAKESQQDISLTHECNGNKQNRLCQETSSPSLYWPVIFKKRRQERRQISGYNMALTTPFGRLQQSELKLLFHPTQRSTGKRSKVATSVCKRIPKAGAEDCSHLLGSEKTKGSFLRRENKNNEPQSCMDALFADARFKTTTKKRRKKRHFCLVSSTLSNMKQEYVVAPNKFSFVGQPLVLELAESQWKNLNQTQFCSIQDCHWRSSGMQRSFYANFQPQAVVPYMDPVEFIVERMKHMQISEDQIQAIGKGKHALIPYGGGSMLVPYKRFFDIVKKQRPRAKVDLDPETNRVWNLLMWKTSGDEAGGVDMDKEKWWKEEREIFRGRADAFIARMHLILGDRRFSKWKGSVVDSVVGVFLTQNVSDHLSSSAFMSLAARFPLQTRGKSTEANVENMNTSEEQGDGNVPAGSDIIKWQEKMSMPEVIDPVPTGIYKKEKEAADVSSSLGSNNRNETDCLEANVLQSHGSEQEIRTEAPQNRIKTPVPATGVISLRKNEDGMILEDVVLSQTSVISLEESSEYQIQTGQVGLFSESVTQSEDLVIRSKCIASDNPASFIDCSLIRETRTTNESYNNGDGGKLSAENTGTVDQEAACKKVEKRKEVAEKLCCPDGAFPSVNMSNILVSHPQHDTKDLSPSPSTHHCTHNFLNTGPIRMENADTVTGGVGSSWVSTAFEITRTYDINIIEGGAGQQTLLTKSMTIMEDGSHVSNRKLHAQTSTCSESQNCLEKHIGCQDNLPGEKIEESLRENIFHELSQVHDEQSIEVRPEERYTDFPAENTDKEVEIPSETQHCGAQAEYLSSCNDLEETLENLNAVQFDIENKVCSTQNVQPERGKSTPRAKKVNGGETEKKMFDWDGLRKDAFLNGAKNERSSDTFDSLDWEAVRNTDVSEISNTIRERGMNNVLAQRIKDFLNRLVTDHGGIDLEWLRHVPPEKAKDYLLSIRGLGIKSVECVRLLTLHHLAFPVDTNVGRIAVRLGWVPLQPLPESLQLHLLELYPMIEHIQKYLWPRLCTLDQQTLYELHYQMITFGKVFCTKTKPNCNACPMRGECKHFASAFASARLALPGPEEKGLLTSKFPSIVENDISRNFRSLPLPQLDGNKHAKVSVIDDCQPIIEEPTTPEHECTEALETAIEDAFYEDHEDIPTIKLSSEEFKENLKNYMQENKMEIQDEDMSKALVAITVEAASIPMPKLKNVSRLRTEHLVYELPDSHPLLEGMDYRVPDDPSPYLLAIWTPGETAQSMEPPQSCCNSEDSSKLCDRKTCFACNTVREAEAQIVRGTILIPCRTAMKGSFPLNGTYFQVNEVFADHISSRTPIDVPRKWIWNLPRRTVFFGTSVPTIFRGLTTESIQRCFWRGFVCVRGFDRITRAPKPLYARLHFPPSKAVQNNKTPAKEGK